MQFISKFYTWDVSHMQTSGRCLTWQHTVMRDFTPFFFLQSEWYELSSAGSVAASSANENRNLPGVFSQCSKMVLFRCKTILIPSVLDKFQIDFFQSQIINNCMKCANQFLVFVLRQSIAKITKFSISSTYALKINTGRLLHIVWMLNVYCASFNIQFVINLRFVCFL